MSSVAERGLSTQISSRRKEASGVVPAIPAVSKFVEAVAFLRNPHIFAYNLEHLDEAHKQAEGGMEFMMAANHLSHWDHAAIEQALERNGYGALREKHVYPLGISLQKNKAAQLMNRMLPTIPVWPTRFPAVGKEEERKKLEMNIRGSRAIVESRSEGKTIVIYPEASRGEQPEIEEVDPRIHGYFRQPNMVILPIALTGTEFVLPKGEWWPKPYPVTVTFGEPVYTNERLEANPGLAKDAMGKLILDDVMTEIARNLPECYRGIYADRV